MMDGQNILQLAIPLKASRTDKDCTILLQRYGSLCQGRIQGEGPLGRSPPVKPTKVTLCTIILYNSEKIIRDMRPVCSCFVTTVL